MIYRDKKFLLEKLVWLIMISLSLAGCTRSMPVQSITPVFPVTSTAQFTTAPTSTISVTALPSSLDVPAENDNKIKIIDTGHFGNEILIVVLELPLELKGRDFQGMLDSNQFDCIYQENKIQLYCSGTFNKTDPAEFSLLDKGNGHLIFSQTLDLKEIINSQEN